IVEKIVIEGDHATGVVLHHGGKRQQIQATTEVILAAGAINSPQLLLLSGIGPAEKIERHGITVRHELSGVGKNLCDHPDTVLAWHAKKPVSSYPWTVAPRKVGVGARWLCNQTVPAASKQIESGTFNRTRTGKLHRD